MAKAYIPPRQSVAGQLFDVAFLLNHFGQYGVDGKNKNPSRFSRLPGVRRQAKRQELLELSIGAEDWRSWQYQIEQRDTSKLPAIESASDLVSADVPHPPELIQGVLHQGSKLILGSGSKARKTWILVDLALSVSTGSKFWHWPTNRGRVCYINFEIQRAFIRSRIMAVAHARGITDLSHLDIWNLRGRAAALGGQTVACAAGGSGIRLHERDAAFGVGMVRPLQRHDSRDTRPLSLALGTHSASCRRVCRPAVFPKCMACCANAPGQYGCADLGWCDFGSWNVVIRNCEPCGKCVFRFGHHASVLATVEQNA